jgi:hypothetical protein
MKKMREEYTKKLLDKKRLPIRHWNLFEQTN